MVYEGINNLAFRANIHQNDIESVLTMLKQPSCGKNFNQLISLNRDRFLMCQSPFSSKVHGELLRQYSERIKGQLDDVEKLYREKRKVFVLHVGRKVIPLKQEEVAALAESKVRRNILSKKIALVRVDSQEAVKLLKINRGNGNTTEEYRGNKDDEIAEKHRQNVASVCSCIPPRHVQAQEAQDTVILFVLPQNGEKYANSECGRRDQSPANYPVQVTSDLEIDAPGSRIAIGTSSFVSRPDSRSLASYSFAPSTGLAQSGSTSYRERSRPFNTGTPPRHPDYMEPGDRNLSFLSRQWTADTKPDVTTLVEFGFFFTGVTDLVRCFQCGIGLKDWVRDDQVMREHVKHSPGCPFLLHKLGKDRLDQIKNEIASDSPSFTAQSSASGTQPPYKIRSPSKQTMEARLASFQNFPDVGIQTRLMAVAGLYYTGTGDLCRCFACDGGLKDWGAGDDPCKEHATYFPTCEYIKHLKGTEYVQQQQQRRRNNTSQGATGSNVQENSSSTLSMDRLNLNEASYTHSAPEASQTLTALGFSELDIVSAKAALQRKGVSRPSPEAIVDAILDLNDTASNNQSATDNARTDDVRAIMEEHERLREMMQCMLCVSEEPEILFLPCAHHKVCHKCATTLTKCPRCNAEIKEKIRTYRS